MKVFARQITLLCFFYAASHAQNPVCPSPYVYMDGGSFIKVYDPSQPLSANNPSNTTIPTFGSGLALMPNISGGTLCPTFYTTLNGNYYYWDGINWTNTGHSTGNSSAVNIGGCGSFVYNLVGSSGDVYVYDGTGNGMLLTTLAGFSGGGPFDLTADCDCNFYAINTTTSGAGQSLIKYNPQGVPIATLSLVNMPNASAGGGFGIIGNKVYLKNNLNNGFFVGTISGSSVTFTQVTGFTASPGDFASCPTCTTPPAQLSAHISGAALSCYSPTASLVVTTTASPVSYSWTGPGIMGPITGSVVSVNSPGTYSCLVRYLGCPNAQVLVHTTVTSFTSQVIAQLTPTGNICVSANEQHVIVVAHTSTNEVVTWSGPGIFSSPNSDSIVVTGGGSFSVQVTNLTNGCTARDVVHFAETPTISVSLSSGSMCALPTNGSPAHVTLTASGASNYTFYPDTYLSVTSANGATVVVTSAFNGMTPAGGLVVGHNSFCTDTAQVTMNIFPNPTVAVSPASICPGAVHVFTASGASTYTWSGVGLLNSFGSMVSAAPSSSSNYSLVASQYGCLSAVKFVSLTVLPVPSVSLSPGNSLICLGSSITLTASGSATSYSWSPMQTLSGGPGAVVLATPVSTQVYTVTGSLNGCTATATGTVMVQTPPTLSISMSAQSLCFKNFNGSPAHISIQPAGAANYTLLQGPNFSVSSPFGPVMQITASGPPLQGLTVATATLIGSLGVCTVTKTQNFNIIPNPVVQISPPSASICPGGAAVFAASGASTFTWLPAPGMHTYQASSIIANPKVSGFFAVIGTSLGCHSITKNAVLVVKPVPSLSIVPASATVCAGNSVRLIAHGNAESYSWSPAQSLSASSGQTVFASPMETTNYTVMGFLNSCTNQAVSTVSAITVPTIYAGAAKPLICSGSKTTLHATGAISFSWFPRASLEPDIGPIVNASPAENTTYTVWGYNGVCSGSAAVQVRTVIRPDLKVYTEGGQNAICSGSSLPVMTSGATNYQWSPSKHVFMISSNTMVLVSPPVNTNFTVLGTTSEGTVVCPQLVSFSVVVVPRAVPLVSGDQRICAGDRTTIEAKGGNVFRWIPEDGLNDSRSGRVVASPSMTTVYTVDVSHSGYCASTATVMVEVVPKPSVFAGRDTSWHVNDAIFLAASGTGKITWLSGDGISCASCPTTQVYPARSDCYVVQAENEYGCLASDVVCLEISEDFYLYIPNSFTPDGDGLNDVFLVYGENVDDVTLQVFDRWGQLVFFSDDALVGWDGTFRGTRCKPDTYVYKLSYKGMDRKTYHRTGHVTIVR